MITLYNAALKNIDRARGQSFNIGGGIENSLSLLELFKLLEELGNCKMRYVSNKPRESDQRVFVADIGKAKRLLDWQPQVSAREGVASMLKWVQSAI